MSLTTLFLLAGCATDFGLTSTKDVEGDTGEVGEAPSLGDIRLPDGQEGEDTGELPPEDTGGFQGGGDDEGEDMGPPGSGGVGGPDDEPPGDGEPGDDLPDDGPPGEGDLPPEDEPLDDPAPEDDCEGTSDEIYVVERDYDTVYTFDPETLSFTELGELDCSMWGSPNSMAVARDGVAYVRYSDNEVYEVDLGSLGCAATSYSDSSFGAFGMGFATDEAGGWRDQLYVANEDTVARLDTGDWRLSAFGDMESQSELTGNSAGELWAFLPLERPAALVQLDKESGEELDRRSLTGFPSAGDIDAFAFATWGGEFWLFVRTYGVGNSTDVYRVEEDGSLSLELERVGFDVVGAGVSTGAPSE
jgi:hypothetical protein